MAKKRKFAAGDIVVHRSGLMKGKDAFPLLDAPAPEAPAAEAPKAEEKPSYDGMSFKAAFAAARKAKPNENFTWKGKSFNTKLAGEGAAAGKKSAPVADKPKNLSRGASSAPGSRLSRGFSSPSKTLSRGFSKTPSSAPAPVKAPAAKPKSLDKLNAEATARPTLRQPDNSSKVDVGRQLKEGKRLAEAKAQMKENWRKQQEAAARHIASSNNPQPSGHAKGGSVRGNGCAKRGHGKGRMV